jgi:hypothetical protein
VGCLETRHLVPQRGLAGEEVHLVRMLLLGVERKRVPEQSDL